MFLVQVFGSRVSALLWRKAMLINEVIGKKLRMLFT